jgi:hypothetical protein
MIATVDELLNEVTKINQHKKVLEFLKARNPNCKVVEKLIKLDQEMMQQYEDILRYR